MLKRQKQGESSKLFSKDKKLNETLHKHHFKKQLINERNKLSQLLHNFQPGFLEPEYEGDQTIKVKQKDIINSVNIQASVNAFQLRLGMGDYQCQYSRNGASMMLTSSQGHLAVMDWREKDLTLEINLREKIVDSTFLHNDEMMALSQLNHTFIYDSQGIQLHKLPASLGVQYLPYHFLLTLYDNRKLKYYDTTTGHIIADHNARNNYTVMTQNKSNAIIAMGTSKGVVEYWTPGVGTAQIQLFIGGKVDGIAFHKGYMYTVADQLKIWDTRMLKVLHSKELPRRAKGIEVSDSGIAAINYGFKVQFWKDLHLQKQTLPYLRHDCSQKYTANNLKFAPFEDIVGLGTSQGFQSIIVPGSGVPYFDTFENNPFESKKQKRESLVHKLLEKLPFQTITIDPNVLGGISRLSKQQLEAEEKVEAEKKQKEHIERIMSKNKSKGNKISKKINKRQIEMDKIKRAELTKVLNTKLWAKRAERKKKQSELSLIQQMQSEGLGVADLIARQANSKGQSIQQQE